MNEYDFTLKFALPDPEANPEQYVGALCEAGCEDAVVGIGQNGRIALHFIREAASAHEAVTSAIAEVQKAIPGATLIEATPDFVGLTDIAALLGCTRQNVRKYMVGHRSFPSPIHESGTAIWHLAHVLMWFNERGSRTFEERLVEIAKVNMQVNLERQMQDLRILAPWMWARIANRTQSERCH